MNHFDLEEKIKVIMKDYESISNRLIDAVNIYLITRSDDCSYYDFMNIDSLLDGLAFDRAWIEDRLNNDDKRRRYKKIRKALGYSS